MSEPTPDEIDGDATDLIADGATYRSVYAWAIPVAAKLWRDEAHCSAFLDALTSQPTPGYVRVDKDRRVAASFGQLVHDRACTFGMKDGYGVDGECTDECVILPCDEADASVVMIRVEVNVRKVEGDACASCGQPATTTIILNGVRTPACLRHYNVWETPHA